MAKSNTRVCRFIGCKHESNIIDISKDKFIRGPNNMYYHEDCYKYKKYGDGKDAETRATLVRIRDIWGQKLNPTVNYAQLTHTLNEFIAKGISAEYLLFVVNYCINNHWTLRYPGGLKYYVDREEVKTAYNKKKAAEEMRKYEGKFVATESDDAPTFEVKKKQRGFQTILR